MNTQFESLRITTPTCTGDIWSNEMVDQLSAINGRRRKHTKQLKTFIQAWMDYCEDRWLFRRFTKSEMAALCALANSATQATFDKRALNYLNRILVECSVYGAIFNAPKARMFQQHFDVR